jgi:hypothetical protein
LGYASKTVRDDAVCENSTEAGRPARSVIWAYRFSAPRFDISCAQSTFVELKNVSDKVSKAR